MPRSGAKRGGQKRFEPTTSSSIEGMGDSEEAPLGKSDSMPAGMVASPAAEMMAPPATDMIAPPTVETKMPIPTDMIAPPTVETKTPPPEETVQTNDMHTKASHKSQPEVTGTNSDDEEGTAPGSAHVSSPHGDSTRSVSEAEAPIVGGTGDLHHVSVVCDRTQPGESLALVGAHPALGAWDTRRAVVMGTSAEAFPMWSAELPCGTAGSEYKLVIMREGGDSAWEPIDGNRTLPAEALSGTFLATFGEPP